ncbi:lipopolysaccharide assembly protein LapA domain-containing protein [Fluctibacter halophilus]|uniref:lipopolysaccharide assembly protein LapA domain-containing protein n=1 Tax=Fluctibacter halophilus TaxID=226011 RepID=UPI002B4BC972|nr:lipopolysaccharide assembly protein LapA domain-containing protein [Aestuariibacter halophilus]
MKRFLIVLLSLTILLITVVIGAQNDQLVTVNYLIAQSELKLSALLAVMLVFGIAIAALAFSLIGLQMRWKMRAMKKQLGRRPSVDD